MSNYYVAGVGMTPFGRHLKRSIADLAEEAIQQALIDAECDLADLQTVFYSGATNGYMQGQSFIPGQVALSKMGLQGIPLFNVENGCASGSCAFHLALQSLKSGACDIALAIGAEKMNDPDRKKMFSLFDGAWDVSSVEENTRCIQRLGEGLDIPEGWESAKPYSVFMSIYAAFARNHMKRYGTTARQIAAISAKNHQHSVHNPLAQFQTAYTIDEVLAAPPITYPLTLPMCAPISDGAAAVILCSDAGLRRISNAGSRAVRILASEVRSATLRDADKPELHCAHLAATQAYQQAGLGPEDMDLAEVHDATAMGEILHIENLSLAAFGEAGPRAEKGEFTIGGRVPVNPSGGLESKGHPIGASGMAQIFELITQLRGEAGARQVEDARLAIQENSGGLLGIEEASASINIFGRR